MYRPNPTFVSKFFTPEKLRVASAQRLYDLFLGSSPLMPLYVGAAALVASRQSILDAPCDYAEVHSLLSTLPALAQPRAAGGVPVAILVRNARALAVRLPPAALLRLAEPPLPPDSAPAAWPFASGPVRPDRVLRAAAEAAQEAPESPMSPLSPPVSPFRATGWGARVTAEGDAYAGQTAHNSRHGAGRCAAASGRTVYEGAWARDRRHGPGVSTWSDGASYAGDWAESTLSGYGVFSWPSGRQYAGAWRADRRHGPGELTEPSGLATTGPDGAVSTPARRLALRFEEGREVARLAEGASGWEAEQAAAAAARARRAAEAAAEGAAALRTQLRAMRLVKGASSGGRRET